MKVLQINSVYKNGSTGKIVHDLSEYYLSKGYESIVCYGRHKPDSAPRAFKVCTELESKVNHLVSFFTGIMYGGFYVSNSRLKKIIKKERPDIIHLHCLNGYYLNIYRFVNWLNKSHFNVVLTLHAEFMYTANCGYALECNKYLTGCGKCPRLKKETHSLFIDGTKKSWKLMKESFEGMKHLRIVSVSPWLLKRAKESPILSSFEHSCVLNGIDTDIFKPFAKNEDESDYKTILHVTSYFNNDISNIKGGYYVLKLANLLKSKKIKFVVVGDYDHSIAYPSNVLFVGNVKDQIKLAKYYSSADLTLLCSQKETFSMIVAESLCCGTPIVGFKSGAPEQIAIQEYSQFVDYPDVDELLKVILSFLNKPVDRDEIARRAKEKYSKNRMAEDYIRLYKDLIDEADSTTRKRSNS